MEECPICRSLIQYSPLGSRDAYKVNCPKCGQYHITRTALAVLKHKELFGRQAANISGWLLENAIYEIASNSIEALEKLRSPSFHDRADKLLEYFEKETDFAGQFIEKNTLWVSSSWSVNDEELEELITFLIETRRIQESETIGVLSIKIYPEGWAHLETLKKINADKTQCFVAMWFSDEMQSIYDNVISKAISNAGYIPHKIDQLEHNGKIDDEIIAQIRKSRFVFADFTGHRGGVYFEAGFAKGLGLEVIWSCQDDDIPNLHFDIRQYNCISWSPNKLDEFMSKITNRIEAVLGQGSEIKIA